MDETLSITGRIPLYALRQRADRTSLAIAFQPASFPKNNDQNRSNQNHTNPNNKVTVWRFQFRHMFEVHAINPNNEGEGNKDTAHNRQYFHDVIHSLALHGVV